METNPRAAELALVGCFVLVGVSQALAGKDHKKNEQAEALLARGYEVSNIRAEGSPRFRLLVRARLIDCTGQVSDGEYEENWISPTEWRRTIMLPQYSDAEVRRGDRIYHSGSEQYEPYVIRLLKSCLQLTKRPWFLPPASAARSVKRVTTGSRTGCVELKGIVARTLCYDPVSGTILKAEYNISGFRTQYIYDNYERFGQKLFPRRIKVFQDEHLVAEAEITELDSQPAINPPLFTPPTNAEERVTCDDPQPPRPVEQPAPSYPNKLRGDGKVLVYAVVSTDGTAHNVSAIQSDSPEFSASAIQTIAKRWRFKPATCADQPGPAGLLIEVYFRANPW